MTAYASRLRRLIVEGVDAGNGRFRVFISWWTRVTARGGFYATQVLEPLGADISGSQFLEPDGRFPHHIPNPENEEAMASVCAAVKEHGADLGVILIPMWTGPGWWAPMAGRSTATGWWRWPRRWRWKAPRRYDRHRLRHLPGLEGIHREHSGRPPPPL